MLLACLAHAARYSQVILWNATAGPLVLERADVERGAWGVEPAAELRSGGYTGWRSEAKVGGTAGFVVYRGGTSWPVLVRWTNPVLGPNTWQLMAPPGISARMVGGEGRTTTAEIEVAGSAAACEGAWVVTGRRGATEGVVPLESAWHYRRGVTWQCAPG